MPAGFGESTVRGTFELSVAPAVRSVRTLKDAYKDADTWARRLGESGDRIGTRAQATKVSAYRAEIRGLGKDLRKTAEQAERLDVALTGLGRRDIRPRVDLRGVDTALAKVELLHERINALGRERATPRVALGGAGARGGVGGVGGGARGTRTSVPGTGISVAGGLRGLAIAGAAALPIVQSLTGAVAALAGSLLSAAGAAGAVGISGGASLAVGLGAIVAVSKPAIARIGDVYKAQQAVNQAQQDSIGIAAAHQQAQNAVRQAEEALTNSQIQAKNAQLALTTARRDARRELTDMRLAQDSARLSASRANLELRRARMEYRNIQLNPTATNLDIADARQSVLEAQLGVREARVTRSRAIADNRRTQRLGVRGNPQVVSARQGVRSAAVAERDARIGLRQATQQLVLGATQIASAKTALNLAFARAPRGTRQLVNDFRALQRLWGADPTATNRAGVDPAVARAQRNVVGIGRVGTRTARRMTPFLGGVGARVTSAVAAQADPLARFVSGSQTRRFITDQSTLFDQELGPARRTAQFVAETMMNISEAARPFVREGMTFIEHWTNGWAKTTGDVGKTQGFIGKMVDDLKAWGRLTGAAGRLTFDVAMAGRGAGRGGVQDMTRTLNRWDAWIRRNPQQVQAFFTRTVKSAEGLARAVGAIARALNHLATQLAPVLDNFTTLVSLAGQVGLVGPGGVAAAFGAYRGVRGYTGGAGGAGGGGLLGAGGAAAGAGAGAGLGWAARGRATYQVGRTLGAGRFAAARGALPGLLGGGGGAVGGGVRALGMGAARAWLPLALLSGALSAYSLKGRGPAQRLQAFLSPLSMGNIPMPKSGQELSDNASRYVSRWTGGLSAGTTAAGLRHDVQRLRTGQQMLRGTDFDFGSGKERARNIADAQRGFRRALSERLGMLRDFRRQRDAILDEHSRANADRYFGDTRAGFAARSRREGTVAGFTDTVTSALGTAGGMRRRAGVMDFGQQTLTWAHQQAQANPRLWDQYRRLRDGIVSRLHNMGSDVSVVGGQILDGTHRQWKAIADEMASQARRGVDETSAEYKRLQRLARGELRQMGYTGAQATAIIEGTGPGSTRSSRAVRRNLLRMGPTAATSISRMGAAHGAHMGDGIGDGPGPSSPRAGMHGLGAPNLMGANRGMGVYAAEGARFGLGVSSGLRENAITASGNRSLHADGWAIDESGSAGNMLRFARYMARHYGSGLDELIHTPLGYGIKNGKRVPLSFWGSTINAEHYSHVHVGDRTPGPGQGGARGNVDGAPGGVPVALHARPSTLPGVTGALSTEAGAAYATALTAVIRRAAGAGGGGRHFAGGGNPSANERLGRRMMLAHGWGAGQWPSLDALWTGESGWNARIRNSSSGATGIPQALPGNKMASAGSDWQTNPATQIAWGLDYIAGRYGSPSAAYQQWLARSPHWYGKGGQGVYRGPTMIGVGDGQPSGGYERVTVSRERPSSRGRGHGGGGQVHMHFDLRGATITSEAHARELIEAAADRAAHKLLGVLEDAVPESELVG